MLFCDGDRLEIGHFSPDLGGALNLNSSPPDA
jgi:hypothetical protein